MIIKSKKNIYKFIEIKNFGFFLSDQGFDFLLDLKKKIDGALTAPVDKVVFIQNEKVSDSLPKWQAIHKNVVMLETLQRRILFVRSLLDAIRCNENNFIYIGRDDCLGSYWDLALSCGYRIWFGSHSKVGFPGISYHLYPIGGGVEEISKKASKVKENWENNCIYDINQAINFDLIDFFAGDFYDPNYVIRYLETHGFESKKITKKNVESEKFNELSWDELILLERKWIASKNINNLSSSWHLAWTMLKTKRWFKSEQDFENLLSYLLAKFFLQDNLQVLSSSHRPFPRQINISQKKEIIYINSQFWAPPIKVFMNLLLAGYYLIFFSENPLSVSSLLERIYSKIERMDNKAEIYKLWETSVSWFSGDQVQEDKIQLHWTLGDILEIKYAGKEFLFYNLESNLFDAEVGYVEGLNNEYSGKHSDSFGKLLSVVSKGVIEEFVVGDNIPLSCWVRLMFLEELINTSNLIHESDIVKVMQSLGAKGWRFAASEARWEYFLQTRRGEPVDQSKIQFPSKEVWDLGKIRHIQPLLKPKDKHQISWTETQLSNHLALYCAVLSNYLWNLNLFSSYENAELLISESVGYPYELGNPKAFFEFWGKRRGQLYIEKYWLKLEGSTHESC